MNLSQYVAYPHRRQAAEAIMAAGVLKTTKWLLRRRLMPGVAELAELSGGLVNNAPDLLARALREAGGTSSIDSYGREHDALNEELGGRYRERALAFPATWAVEAVTSFFLYALVRTIRPHHVVEIGVGNGQSSFYFLRALQANGSGQLHSFDISSEAGGLLNEDERSYWDFRLVDKWKAGASLVRQLEEIPRADVAFHDGDHGYLAQYFELSRLWEHLNAPKGVLVSDDVDVSYAFIDFCREVPGTASVLIDGRKALGVMTR
jgi:predicted O-methyltransferase YrrM